MQNLKAYRQAREDLLWDALSLVGLIATQLPVRVAPGSPLSRSFGSQWESEELRLVSKKLEDVTYRFDQIQHSLGLWKHDARFGHGPAGSTNTLPTEALVAAVAPEKSKARRPKKQPAESPTVSTENPSMAAKRTTKTKPKPSTKGDPRKQPPKNPKGGSGYNDNHHGR